MSRTELDRVERVLIDTAMAYAHAHVAYITGGYINSAPADDAWLKMMQAAARVERERRAIAAPLSEAPVEIAP